METPKSTRRVVTRSQTKAASAAAGASNGGNRFISASGSDHHDRPIKSLSSRKSRSALFDISNDSPVLGLATGSLKKSGGRGRRPRLRTPVSGESLLRGQVKILLKKVEEEGDQQQFLGHFLGFNGPGDGGGLLAPLTPPPPLFNINF